MEYMTRWTNVLGLAAVVVLTGLGLGCQQEKAELEPVPPPPSAMDAPAYDEPAPVEVEPVVVEPAPVVVEPAGTSYTVVKGDTLYSIAKRVYGNGNRWPDIAAANNISDPKKLRVGQVLVIP